MATNKLQASCISSSGLFDRKWYLSQYDDVRLLNMDPVIHFVKYGDALCRDPNPFFNTRRYKLQNQSIDFSESVAFYHYLTNCPEARKRTRREKLVGEYSDSTNVFVNVWLQNRETIHEGLTEFSTQLRAMGIKSTFITHTIDFLANTELDAEYASPVLSLGGLYSNCVDAVAVDRPWFKEIAAADKRRLVSMRRVAQATDSESIMKAVRCAYSYWRRRFQDARPSLLLIWGSTTPLSRLFIRLSHEIGLPSMVLERGHFSKTLSVELLGQFGSSGVNLSVDQFALGGRACSETQIGPLLEWIRSCDEVPYAHKNNASVEDCLGISEARRGRKVVVFLGVNDLGCGIGDNCDDTLERHGYLFSSTPEALERVRDAMKIVDPEALLIFKPHPADKHEYAHLESENFIVVDDVNVNRLIESADVCVSLSTTALARAVAEGIPVVLLAISDMTMKGFAYECNNMTDIPVMLRAALNQDGFELKRGRGYAYIKSLFDSRLIGLKPDVPTRNRVLDLSMFVYKRIKTYSDPDHRQMLFQKSSTPCRFDSFEVMIPGELETRVTRPAVEIVIPVYGDAVAVKDCVESVLASTSTDNDWCHVTLVCDKSPYEDVLRLLESYAHRKDVRILHNSHNLGFAGAVNRAVATSIDRDIVLLNSDTIVPPGWLKRMRQVAYARPDIGTVTPLSNNAGVFSNPYPNGRRITEGLAEVERFDALAQKKNKAVIEVPSGHGFCLYIKRICIDSVGYLDEEKFGRGYYEETDFCLRARRLGFVNVCATNVYVGHVGGASFGDEAKDLCRVNREIVREEYPHYFPERHRFSVDDPLSRYRLEE